MYNIYDKPFYVSKYGEVISEPPRPFHAVYRNCVLTFISFSCPFHFLCISFSYLCMVTWVLTPDCFLCPFGLIDCGFDFKLPFESIFNAFYCTFISFKEIADPTPTQTLFTNFAPSSITLLGSCGGCSIQVNGNVRT